MRGQGHLEPSYGTLKEKASLFLGVRELLTGTGMSKDQGDVTRLLSMMVFQFLFYTGMDSVFGGKTLEQYVEALTTEFRKMGTTCEQLGFWMFEDSILQNVMWQAECNPGDIAKMHRIMMEKDPYLSSFTAQPLRSHAINAMLLRIQEKEYVGIYVPTLPLVNLLLYVDATRRYGLTKSLCLGEWNTSGVIDAECMARGLIERKKRLIYFEAKSTTLHGRSISFVEAYAHDLTHVIQMHHLYNLYPEEVERMWSFAWFLLHDHLSFSSLTPEQQESVLEIMLDGYHVLHFLKQGKDFKQALVEVAALFASMNDLRVGLPYANQLKEYFVDCEKAFLIACALGDVEAVHYYIAQGVNVHCVDDKGRNATHYVAMRRGERGRGLLIDLSIARYGAAPSDKEIADCLQRRLAVVDLLLDHHVNFDFENTNGSSAQNLLKNQSTTPRAAGEEKDCKAFAAIEARVTQRMLTVSNRSDLFHPAWTMDLAERREGFEKVHPAACWSREAYCVWTAAAQRPTPATPATLEVSL